MNIGTRPTFDGAEDIHLEVNLLDFDGDLYGQLLHVEFVEWLREERKFGSVAELVTQLKQDRQRCSGVLRTLS